MFLAMLGNNFIGDFVCFRVEWVCLCLRRFICLLFVLHRLVVLRNFRSLFLILRGCVGIGFILILVFCLVPWGFGLCRYDRLLLIVATYADRLESGGFVRNVDFLLGVFLLLGLFFESGFV